MKFYQDRKLSLTIQKLFSVNTNEIRPEICKISGSPFIKILELVLGFLFTFLYWGETITYLETKWGCSSFAFTPEYKEFLLMSSWGKKTLSKTTIIDGHLTSAEVTLAHCRDMTSIVAPRCMFIINIMQVIIRNQRAKSTVVSVAYGLTKAYHVEHHTIHSDHIGLNHECHLHELKWSHLCWRLEVEQLKTQVMSGDV